MDGVGAVSLDAEVLDSSELVAVVESIEVLDDEEFL